MWLPQVQKEKIQLQVTSLLNLIASSFSFFLFLVFFSPFSGSFSYSSIKYDLSYLVTYARVMRTGMPRAHGGRSNRALIKIPFLFIILGTVGLGGLNATRAYRKQKEAHPSHNPFLP